MYAPGIQAVPFGGQKPMMGQYKAQGISGGISALNQGLSQWYQNDAQNNKMKAQTMGIIAQDPSILNQFTDPIAQKSLTKVRDGSANAKDILIAYGATTAAKEAKTEQLKNQFVQAQIVLLQQQQQTQAKAAADAERAKQNLNLAGLAQTNPNILSNDAYKRGLAIASDPLFGVARASQQLGIDPAVAAQFSAAMGRPRPQLKIGTIRSADDKGNPINITVDELTGRELGRGPVVPAAGTPQQQAETASLVEQAKAKADDAQKYLTEISDNAETARVRASSIGRINALYDAGATTGYGQKQLTDMQAVMARIGFAKKGLADQQALNKEVNNIVMEVSREYAKGGGQVSNYERDLFKDATANTSMTPEANRKILGVMANIAARSVQLDRKRQELDEKGFPPVEIARQLRKLRDSIPIGIEAIGGTTLPAGWEEVKP